MEDETAGSFFFAFGSIYFGNLIYVISEVTSAHKIDLTDVHNFLNSGGGNSGP